MAKNRSIKKRQLLILQHLFDDIYKKQKRGSKYIIDIGDKFDNPTCSDYFKLVSDGKNADVGKSNYGSKPLPKYIRFNDVLGIRYKVNETIKGWKGPLMDSGQFMGISGEDLEEIEYDTLFKELNKLADEFGILVKSDNNNVKRKGFYYPNETIEGFSNLLDYLLPLPLQPNDEFGMACRTLVFSWYSRIVLNREYVIQNMRKKDMRVEFDLIHNYPYLGHYRKIFECPEPLEKLVSMCEELKRVIPDKDLGEMFAPAKSVHEAIDQLEKHAQRFLSQINDIQAALSDREQNEDQLARLSPKEWFTLDYESELRQEARWMKLELSPEDIQKLLEIYAEYGNRKVDEISDDEKRQFLRKYSDAVEINVLYTLSMISNSYWALMYFHLHRYDNFFKIWKENSDPYRKLFGPSITNSTGNYGQDDIFWDRQLYRFVLYEYAMGTCPRVPSGPFLMGLGQAKYGEETIPATMSFRITPRCFLAVNGELNHDYDAGNEMNVMHTCAPRKYIEKRIYGPYYNQSYLLDMFSIPGYRRSNIDAVLKELLQSIDCYGNCSKEPKYFGEMFSFKDNRY